MSDVWSCHEIYLGGTDMKLDQALVAGFMMTIAKPGFRVQVRSFYGILNSPFNILSSFQAHDWYKIELRTL